MKDNINKYLNISAEVQKAIDENRPIVALESTIISHGMPYPQNLEVAKNCEKIIRDANVTPATIAIMDGKLCIGLNERQLEVLAKSGRNVRKVSRRDIPYVLYKKLNGATTVSATMYIASLANIKIFATGGIGGVHRDANLTFDISCDLEELSKTNVSVVCAGAKAILDLPKTLEYLETKGVLVLGYKTKMLPSFYSSTSNYFVDEEIDSPEEIANILKIKWDLGLNGGILITNPVPKEMELDKDIMNKAIDEALKEANEKNITGKEVTPFLLAKICELTSGNSLNANIALVYNNCKLAASIAKKYRELDS